MPGNPFILGITVNDSDGNGIGANIKVSIRNENTNESADKNTNASSETVFNLGSSNVFESGWTAGDIISYSVSYQNFQALGSFAVTDTGGTTKTLTLVALPEAPSLRYFTVQEFLDTYSLPTYDVDNENGIKPQIIVKVGQSIETRIDKKTYRKWDDNAGDYYAVTNEYQTVKYFQKVFWLENTPVNSITRLEVNVNPIGSEEDWKNIMFTLLDAMDATTDWAAGTDGAIALNTTNNQVNEGTGCLNITKTGATTASVLFSKTLGSAFDFTGTTFKIDFYNEDNDELVSSGTAVQIRIGSDASNYYSYNYTKSDIGQGGWNTLSLIHDSDDSNAGTTGTPSPTACNYIAINITYASSATTVTVGDMRLDYARFNNQEDVNIDYPSGRVEITSASNHIAEPGTDQFRSTYKQGVSSVPEDIKRLAIIMTAKAFAKSSLQSLNINANEVAGLSSAIQNLAVDDMEIKDIIEINKFPPILNSWKENPQY